MTGQETPNKLTDYWAGREVEKGQEMAILTNIIHQEWTVTAWRRTSRQRAEEPKPVRSHD